MFRWSLLHPVPGMLERHAQHRTSHAAPIDEVQSLLAGSRFAPPHAGPRPPLEPLSKSELRVMRYLPTNLTAPEIARELYVSRNTVKVAAAWRPMPWDLSGQSAGHQGERSRHCSSRG
jgi:LuxR family maltose regulon positive regulatory protein